MNAPRNRNPGERHVNALRADQVGSLLRPSELLQARVDCCAGRLDREGLRAEEDRAILNAHFVAAAPAGAPLMTGVIGGTAEWVFAFPDRLSVTVSAATPL